MERNSGTPKTDKVKSGCRPCPNCKNLIGIASIKCKFCNFVIPIKPIEKPQNPYLINCQSCGSPNNKYNTKCQKCGGHLKDSERISIIHVEVRAATFRKEEAEALLKLPKRNLPIPTKDYCGTWAKIETMRLRFELGQELFHPKDSRRKIDKEI